MSERRVVVTGLGTTSPVGGDVPTTWAALLAGKSGVRPLTEEWAEQLPVKIAARVVEMKTRITVHLPSACPAAPIMRLVLERLPRMAPI